MERSQAADPLELADATSRSGPLHPTSPSQKQSDRKGGAQCKLAARKSGINQSEDNGTFVIRKDVDEVLLHATVVDDKEHIVTNLKKTILRYSKTANRRTIISFHHEDIPVAMGILIDNSGSMREKRAKVNQAALNLVRSSNPQDEVFVVNFNDEYYLDQDFTNDLLKLKEALGKNRCQGRDGALRSGGGFRRSFEAGCEVWSARCCSW